MARNKIRDYERRLAAGVSGERLCPSKGFEEAVLHAFQRKSTVPGEALEQSEQVEKVHQQMTNKEWKLTTERMTGETWQEIASRNDLKKDAIRKIVTRAVARVRRLFRGRGEE